MSAKNKSKLGLLDACGMAIGGMVGGGIFAVLGEAAHVSGNAAFVSFGLAGLLALVTGLSYVRLTLDFDEPGGSFSYVEHIVGPHIAGTVVWFLLLGYVFTISLYAYTFGAYAGRLFGVPGHWNSVLGFAVIALLTVLNLIGVRESGVAEDVLVYSKVAILLGVAGVGMFLVKKSEALPVFDTSVGGSLAAAGLIFVAYEGFQLLTYDYEDISDHHRNLPRAIMISIPAVIVIYVVVSFVATGSLDDQTISAHRETVLAIVTEPLLGNAGMVAVLVAAVFSTASAINATVFSVGRLARRVSLDGELPPGLVRWESGGIPVVFAVGSAVIAGIIQMVGSLSQITTYASLVFLLVFAVVNLCAWAHHSFTAWGKALPVAGCLGCLAAAGTLIADLVRNDHGTLWTMVGIALTLIALRVPYVFLHPHFLAKKGKSSA